VIIVLDEEEEKKKVIAKDPFEVRLKSIVLDSPVEVGSGWNGAGPQN